MNHKFLPSKISLFSAFFLLAASVAGQSSETRKIDGNFDGIQVSGPFSVAISLGPENVLTISGRPEHIKNIQTVVEDGALKIRWIRDILFTGILQIQLTAKTVVNLVTSSSAQINTDSLNGKLLRVVIADSSAVHGTFTGDHLSVVVGASGAFIASVTVKSLNAVISDSGAITLSGTAQNANVVVSGSGIYHGTGLAAQTLSTTVSGSGRAEVNGVQELKATISDTGVVRFVGAPKITTAIEDLGKIEFTS